MKKAYSCSTFGDPLTSTQKNGTLGGRDGSEAILGEDSSWPSSPTRPHSGSPTASVAQLYLSRARLLSEWQAALYAAAELRELELLEEGAHDDD